MNFKIKIKDKEYEVEVLETADNKVKVKIGPKEFIFEKEKEITFAKSSFPKRNFSQKEILAPITGIISKIFIKEGDFLKRGQKTLLLSAMKMENEIVSDFEGKVEKILVKENQKVESGQTLMILK